MRKFDDDERPDGEDGIVKTISFDQPMDFNDPTTIEPNLVQAANVMLQSNTEEVRVAGLAMKYHGPAFAAYMADTKRQDYDKAATICGLTHNFASLLSMVTCASSDNEDELKQATLQIMKHFTRTYLEMVCMNRNTNEHNNPSATRSPYAGEQVDPHHFGNATLEAKRKRNLH